jgi:Mannosyltransferase (PIG-V)
MAFRRRDLFKLWGVLSLGKAVVLLAVYFARSSPNFLYQMSVRWDASWFLSISRYGYIQLDSYAFSPIYPVMINAFSSLAVPSWVAALAIANVLSFAVAAVVYKSFGLRAALLFELFPTYLFYTTVPYSESLVLLVLALSVLFALRGRVMASSASLSLAIFSSYSMAWTLPSYAIAFARRLRWKTLVFYVLPLLTGILIFSWFEASSGSYWIYFTVERMNWHVSFAAPWSQAQWLVGRRIGYQWPVPGSWETRNLPFEVFYIYGAVRLIRMKEKYSVFLGVFAFSTILPLFFIIGGPAESIPRLLLPAYPIFVYYATAIRGRYLWAYALVCLALVVWVADFQTLNFFG